MRIKIITIGLILVALTIGAYRVTTYLNKESNGEQVVVTPVRVMTIETSSIEDSLTYQGHVAPKIIEKISFKSSARLESFKAVIGDSLNEGQVLATLDKADLQLALDGAQSQLDAATAAYEQAKKGARDEDISLASISANKAKEAVNYLSERSSDMSALYETGIISQAELEGVALELSLAESDLALARQSYAKAANGAELEVIEAARAQMAAATTNRDASQSLFEDATYTLSGPRILVEQLYEEGELVPAGYPIAVLRSLEQSVVVGVAGKDLSHIYVGQAVKIHSQNGEGMGSVIRVSELPDESHFLYEVEVGVEDQTYIVGEIVACDIILGNYEGVTIPVTSIKNDGIDYVFVVTEGKATLRQINIETIIGGYAVVTGLAPGDAMIVSNLNRIHENSIVEIEE